MKDLQFDIEKKYEVSSEAANELLKSPDFETSKLIKFVFELGIEGSKCSQGNKCKTEQNEFFLLKSGVLQLPENIFYPWKIQN